MCAPISGALALGSLGFVDPSPTALVDEVNKLATLASTNIPTPGTVDRDMARALGRRLADTPVANGERRVEWITIGSASDSVENIGGLEGTTALEKQRIAQHDIRSRLTSAMLDGGRRVLLNVTQAGDDNTFGTEDDTVHTVVVYGLDTTPQPNGKFRVGVSDSASVSGSLETAEMTDDGLLTFEDGANWRIWGMITVKAAPTSPQFAAPRTMNPDQ